MSHSVRSTAETRRACGGVTVQAAQWSQEGGGHLQRAAGSVTEAEEKELSQRTSAFPLEYIHDGVVQLSEHHKVDGKAGGAVLGGRIAREPGQSVVLLQNKPQNIRCGFGVKRMWNPLRGPGREKFVRLCYRDVVMQRRL